MTTIQLLTDYIPFEGDKDTILVWDNFTNLVGNILRRLFMANSEILNWQDGISYRNLERLSLEDISDMSNVGEYRKNQILEELATVFHTFEKEGLEGSIVPFYNSSEEDELQPDTIDLAESLKEITAGIFAAFNSYREIDDRTLTILRGRNAALMHTPRTLDDIGLEFDVTRERIRQIESKYTHLHLSTVKTENKCLDEIISVLEKSEDELTFISSATQEGLLADEPISVAKLKAILTTCELDDYLVRVEAVEHKWESLTQEMGELSTFARTARNKFGLIDLGYFKSQTNSSDLQAFHAIKTEYPRSILKGNLVLARTENLDTAFENAMGKQLMVFGELDAGNILVGIERQASFRQISILGNQSEQLALIKEIAGTSPNYETYRARTISEPELSDTDMWFLEQFQDSPSGMLHRNEITAASIRDGRNVNSIGVFLLFNPLIRPVGVAVMALANTPIDSNTALNYANVIKAAEDRTSLEFSFQGDKILLKIQPNLNTVAAGVLFPTADLRSMIKNFAFNVECTCKGLDTHQQLRLRPPNFWTGFTSSIKHAMNDHGYSKNDEFRILLDFDRSSAIFLVN